jgi:hypothetical protein
MEKIISLFKRDYEGTRLVYNEVVPGAEWVIAGEGVATRKFDGTCCKVEGGRLFKRYDAKKGKTPPEGFIPAQEPDPASGHWPGWLPVGHGPEDRWFREALEARTAYTGHRAGTFGKTTQLVDGTYELCGPKVQGNPEGFATHVLVKHGAYPLDDFCPRDFDTLRLYLLGHDIEGVVWHHPDGRMVKIKGKDFGFKRPK